MDEINRNIGEKNHVLFQDDLYYHYINVKDRRGIVENLVKSTFLGWMGSNEYGTNGKTLRVR
jgi:hypothetical protein